MSHSQVITSGALTLVDFPAQAAPKYNWEGRDIEVMVQRLDDIQANPAYTDALKLRKMPPEYANEFTSRVIVSRMVIIVLVIAGITSYFLFATGHLQTLPQDFMEWIHHIDPFHAAVGGGIATILIGGALFIIYRATHRKDPIFKKDRGTFTAMDKVLETAQVIYTDKEGNPHCFYAYIDTSTSPRHIYHIKGVAEHYAIHTIITLATPLYLIGTIVYNVIRTVIISFYVLIQYCREKLGYRKIETGERSFELLDAPKEMVKSIIRVVKAPFYALAFFFACLYAFVNPMGGRKLIAAIEEDWNEGVTLSEGYWSAKKGQELFQFEGGGGPNGLGRNGFYLAGCDQAAGYEDQDGAYYMSRALHSEAGVPYKIERRSDLLKTANFDLIKEAEALRKEIKYRKSKEPS